MSVHTHTHTHTHTHIFAAQYSAALVCYWMCRPAYELRTGDMHVHVCVCVCRVRVCVFLDAGLLPSSAVGVVSVR